jgi:hypothetical protein
MSLLVILEDVVGLLDGFEAGFCFLTLVYGDFVRMT